VGYKITSGAVYNGFRSIKGGVGNIGRFREYGVGEGEG